jgi:hypothetical protein
METKQQASGPTLEFRLPNLSASRGWIPNPRTPGFGLGKVQHSYNQSCVLYLKENKGGTLAESAPASKSGSAVPKWTYPSLRPRRIVDSTRIPKAALREYPQVLEPTRLRGTGAGFDRGRGILCDSPRASHFSFSLLLNPCLAELVRCGLLQLEHFGVRGTPFGFEVFGPATLHTGAPNPPAVLKSVFLPVSIRTSAWRWNSGVEGGKGVFRGTIDHLTRRQIPIKNAIRFRLRVNFKPPRFAA